MYTYMYAYVCVYVKMSTSKQVLKTNHVRKHFVNIQIFKCEQVNHN